MSDSQVSKNSGEGLTEETDDVGLVQEELVEDDHGGVLGDRVRDEEGERARGPEDRSQLVTLYEVGSTHTSVDGICASRDTLQLDKFGQTVRPEGRSGRT